MRYSEASGSPEKPFPLPVDTVHLAQTAFEGSGLVVPSEGTEARSTSAEATGSRWQKLRRLGTTAAGALVERLRDPSEVAVRELIQRAESVIVDTFNRAPLPERKTKSCGLVSDVFRYVAEDDTRFGSDVQAEIYQLQDVHAAALGIDTEDSGLGEAEGSFRHAFNVATVGKKKFLVDLSFSQFLSPLEPNQDILRKSMLAQKLVRQGYVPLSDSNLREYLRITSADGRAVYADNVTPAIFDKLGALDFDDDERPELYPGIGR